MQYTNQNLKSDMIEEVRQKSDIIEIVSDRVNLKKQGKDYLGLCPFHDEKTPSFSVSPEKRMYYCFGCQAGGDAIKFLTELDKKPFRDVVLGLAERYSVPVQFDGQERESKVVNIRKEPKSKKAQKPTPIPAIELCELSPDREPSPQPAETALLRKPKKAGENADNFEDIIYRYNNDQWVVRTQWLDPDRPKGRDKTYCQWHSENGKAIAKKGEKVWPAYRIEEAIAALSNAENGNAIIWVEGEPNVESMRDLGLAAITLMGANWQAEAIEDALMTLIHEAQPPVVIDLIESDKPGLGKKDKLRSVCAERSIPYVRIFPCDLWPEKPVDIASDTADITDLISALGEDEVRRRLKHRLSEIPASEIEEQGEEEEVEVEDVSNIFHSKLNRKRLRIERGLGARLAYNEFKKRIELDGKPICEDLDDQGGAKLFIAEQLDMDIADADAIAVLNRTAKKQRYHPVRDYLEECYASFKNDTQVLDDIALRYFGTTEPIHQTYIIKHLIGSVRRIFEPGCKHDSMLILKGEQGARKSTWFRVLYGDENFTDSVLGTEEKDSLMALSLYWACEYGEFETITSKKDVSQLKSWLARNKDDYRTPYAKTVKAHPRTFVLVGSTNRDDFLRDETGSRRFMVIPVLLPFIPVEQLIQERDRIWGAAVALYRAGVSSDLSRIEMKLQKTINEDYSQVDPWAEIIASYLCDFPNEEFISTKTILEKALAIEPRQMDSQATRRCSAIMTQMGWDRQRRRHQGIQQWGWVISPVPDAVPDSDVFAGTAKFPELAPGVRVEIANCPDGWTGEKGTIARAKNWMGRVEYWWVGLDKGGERKYKPDQLRAISVEEVKQLDLLSSVLEPGDFLEEPEEDGDRDNDDGGSAIALPQNPIPDGDDGGNQEVQEEKCDRAADESVAAEEKCDHKGMILSMTKTINGILSSQKKVTRRDWSDVHATKWCKAWDEGRHVHQAWDKSPHRGGKFLTQIRLTARPYQERLVDMPKSDVALECVPGVNSKQEFIAFAGGDRLMWVVRFECLGEPDAASADAVDGEKCDRASDESVAAEEKCDLPKNHSLLPRIQPGSIVKIACHGWKKGNHQILKENDDGTFLVEHGEKSKQTSVQFDQIKVVAQPPSPYQWKHSNYHVTFSSIELSLTDGSPTKIEAYILPVKGMGTKTIILQTGSMSVAKKWFKDEYCEGIRDSSLIIQSE